MKLSLESIFHPELPDKATRHKAARDADVHFDKTQYRPDSSNTFPYEKESVLQQTDAEIKDLLTVESFLGTGAGIPKRNNSRAMSQRKLSYGGGDGIGASTLSWSNYHINPDGGDPIRDDDQVVGFSKIGNQKAELEKEDEIIDQMRESRGGSARASQEGCKMITTKNGWVNGLPSDTGVEPQTDEEIKQDLGISEKLSLKRIYEWATSDFSRVAYTKHANPEDEDLKFFDIEKPELEE